MEKDLFDPFALGAQLISNRLVMAPMTRNRAAPSGEATAMMAAYYAQRATAGLIISESVPVSPQAVGYPCTPCLYSEAQAAAWRRVTDAVHAAGGRIFVQLQHCGRISHPSLQPASALPVAPSAVRPAGQAVTYTGPQDFVAPRALASEELPGIPAQFRAAARLARQAGFDGVEIHGANGYLLDQFLRDGSNRRTDEYGGSLVKRARLLLEVVRAVCEEWPSDRVGVRLSPENSFNDMHDSDPAEHFGELVHLLSATRLAFLHVLEGDMQGRGRKIDYRALRAGFSGAYIANNGYDLATAQAAIASGAADLVAFGVPFLANPDLVHRFRHGLPLNAPEPASFYGGGEAGYTDYPLAGAQQMTQQAPQQEAAQ